MQDSNKALIEKITRLVIAELTKQNEIEIPIGVSNRHIHLSREDMDILFGDGYELTVQKELKQPGQYAAKEVVTVKGPKGSFDKVRILGPVRNQTQLELSLSDGFKLGITPPIRESGQLKGSAGIEIIGPKGSVIKQENAIAALRHIHMTPDIAERLGVHDKDIVEVEAGGIRKAVLGNVLVRVSANYALEMHVDLDEANACGLKNDDTVRIVRKGS